MKYLSKFVEIVTSIMVVVTVVAVAAGVYFRYILESSLTYTFELSTLMYAHIIFWGISLTLEDDSLIGVDLLTSRLSQRAQNICSMISTVIMIAISAFLSYQGALLAMRTNAQLSALGVSIRFLYISVPIGFGCFALQLVGRLVKTIKGKGEEAL